MQKENEYIKKIQRRKNKPRNVLDHVEDGRVHFDVFQRILSNWPVTKASRVNYTLFPDNRLITFNNLDDYLNNHKTKIFEHDGFEQFRLEFGTICLITMIISDLLPPPKMHVKREHEKLIKKLKPITESIVALISEMDESTKGFVSEVVDKQVQSVSQDDKGPQNVLDRFLHFSSLLDRAILLDTDESDKYFDSYKGGHVDATNRRSAIKAIAESFELCFSKSPTTSESGDFVNLVRAFVGWFDNQGLPFEESLEVREHTLTADVKNIIKIYHSKS